MYHDHLEKGIVNHKNLLVGIYITQLVGREMMVCSPLYKFTNSPLSRADTVNFDSALLQILLRVDVSLQYANWSLLEGEQNARRECGSSRNSVFVDIR